MSVVKYRGNLSSAYFPLLSELEGRTVIVPKQDNNFNRQLQSSADTDKDIGIPQIYYGHNIMPTEQGFQAIGYRQQIAAAGSNGLVFPNTTFSAQYMVYEDDLAGSSMYCMLTDIGFYVCTDFGQGYVGTSSAYVDTVAHLTVPFPSDLKSRIITTAHVQGISYIYISNLVCLRFNFTDNVFESVELKGLDPYSLIGIVGSSGYLLAYSDIAVAWSSTIDVTDFVPSIITGAAGGNVEEVKGSIVFASQTAQGLLFYTKKNVVNALYTNNSRYPFAFNEVQGAGGITSPEQVTYEAATGFNYAYTTFGLQSVQDKTASTIFPDFTDFLSGQYFEDYNELTNNLELQVVDGAFKRKLVLVASRYLVLSYGIGGLTHALVYDVTRKRWGKLKIPHVDCFALQELDTPIPNIQRRALAFLQADGTVQVVNFALFGARSGVLILGKYQFVRDRNLQLQSAQLENINPGDDIAVQDWVSWYGKSYDQKLDGMTMMTDGLSRHYGFGSPDGLNHTLLVRGAFNLNTVQLAFNTTSRMPGGY